MMIAGPAAGFGHLSHRAVTRENYQLIMLAIATQPEFVNAIGIDG
jgi:hypothetical protein